MATKNERLEIRAKEGFINDLNRLAEASGATKAEVIDRAIGLYATALHEIEQGKTVKFVFENEVTTPNHDSVVDLGSIRYKDKVLFEDGSTEIVNEIDVASLNLGDIVVYQDGSSSVVHELHITDDAAWKYSVNWLSYSKCGLAKGTRHIIRVIPKD